MQRVFTWESKFISIMIYGSYMDKNIHSIFFPSSFEEKPCLHYLASHLLWVTGGETYKS